MSDPNKGRWRLTRDLDGAEWVPAPEEPPSKEFKLYSVLGRDHPEDHPKEPASKTRVTYREWREKFPFPF